MPSLQPVIENALLNPETTIVCSFASSDRLAGLIASTPSYTSVEYISSDITSMSRAIAKSIISFNSCAEYTAPVGFEGLVSIKSLVFGVHTLSSCWTVTLKSAASVAFTYTGVPPASFTISG